MSYTGFYNVTAVNPIMTGADSGTSGVGKVSGITVTANPTAPSTRVVYGSATEVNYTSNQALQSGGWLTGDISTVQVAGSGNVDKIATNMAVTNHVGTGTVTSALGYEAVVSFVGPTSNIQRYAAYYVPNLSGVPNINRIAEFGGFVNDYAESFNRTAAPFYNATFQEFTPPYHPGLVENRYYSAPHRYVGDNSALNDRAYLVPIFIPHRTTIKKLGFNLVSTNAGNAKLALYTAEKGKVQNLVWQSNPIPCTAPTGNKEVDPNIRVEAGTYYIALSVSVNTSMKFHSPDGKMDRSGLLGSATSTDSDNNLAMTSYVPTPYLPVFPAQLALVPTFGTAQEEPHLWFRV